MRKALYILGDLSEADISWLAGAGEAARLEAGRTLIRIGEAVQGLCIILEGKLAVLVEDGRQIATLGAGDIVGEMSLIEKRPPEVSITVVESARILLIPMSRLREKLETDVAFAARFYRALAVFLSDRLRETTSRIAGDASLVQKQSWGAEVDLELDEGILDNLHVAGDRMRRLLALLEHSGR